MKCTRSVSRKLRTCTVVFALGVLNQLVLGRAESVLDYYRIKPRKNQMTPYKNQQAMIRQLYSKLDDSLQGCYDDSNTIQNQLNCADAFANNLERLSKIDSRTFKIIEDKVKENLERETGAYIQTTEFQKLIKNVNAKNRINNLKRSSKEENAKAEYLKSLAKRWLSSGINVAKYTATETINASGKVAAKTAEQVPKIVGGLLGIDVRLVVPFCISIGLLIFSLSSFHISSLFLDKIFLKIFRLKFFLMKTL